MSPKLSAQDRLNLIKRVVEAGEPVSRVCQEAGISRVIFYRWLARYKEEGTSGLTPKQGGRLKEKELPKRVPEKGVQLTPEQRLQMLERVIIEKEPVAKVTREYGISRTLFYRLKKRYEEAALEEKLEAVAPRQREITRWWRQTPEEYEQAVLSLVAKRPDWGVRTLVANLPRVAGAPVVGHHGVQNILRRYNLSTYEARLAWSQAQVTPVIKTINAALAQASRFFALPREVRARVVQVSGTFALAAFLTVVVLGAAGYWFSVVGGVAPPSRIGLVFASTALFMGSIFFLYSMKYYFTLAIVLSFSQQAGGINGQLVNGKNGNGRRNGIISWLLGLANGNGNGAKRTAQAAGLEPSLEHVTLRRKPFVSIHLPFYNEKNVANRILAAVTAFDYPNYEVVVVDDSTDETVQILKQWKSHPKVKIVHRETRAGFKGGALAEALKHTDPRAEFIIVFDADFVPYPDTIELFLKYFKVNNNLSEDYKKSKVACVQGYQWHVLNKSENWITRGIRSEYAGSYVIERSGNEILGALKMIAGSVYMARRDLLDEFGWGTSITEDFELTLRLYEAGYRVVYTPYIQAPAECVSTIRRLVRQRMRWAEGHSHNVRKMFLRLIRSPNLSFTEKLEFLYLSPYYLQATFFLIGTTSWLLAETIFPARLPFWTSLWGWSLVLTNLLSLPLMNTVGLFLEEAEERDYLGALSFVALSYILVPFQAYAAIKGFLEREEGPWFRTPKTGKITDIFTRGRFYRLIAGILPGGRPAPAVAQSALNPLPSTLNPYLALATANNRFDNFRIRPRHIRWIGNVVFTLFIFLTSALIVLSPLIPFVPTIQAEEPGELITVEEAMKNPVDRGKLEEITTPRAIHFPTVNGEKLEMIFHQEPRVRIKLGAKEMEITSLEIEGIGKASPKRSLMVGEREVKYEEIVDGVDLVYKLSKKGFEEQFIVKRRLPIKGVIQRVNLKEVRVVGPTPDVFGIFDGEENEVFKFGLPYLYELNSKENQDRNLKLTLEKDLVGYKLRKTLRQEAVSWLNDPSRSYPIILDPSVIVSGGVLETEVEFGGNQTKLVYSTNSNKWYAFAEVEGATAGIGDVVFYDSADGATWDPATSLTSSATCSSNPSAWKEGALIYVVYNTTVACGGTANDDELRYRTIDTASADGLGTECATGDLQALDANNVNSIAVVGTNVFMINDSDPDFMRTTTSCGTPTAVATGHGVTAADRPVLVEFSSTLHVFFQDGQLSWSRCADGVCDATGDWTPTNIAIVSNTNAATIFAVTTDDTNIWVLALDGAAPATATVLYTCGGLCDASGDWSTLTTPYTGQTNITSTSITLDTTNNRLYAHVIKDSSEQAFFRDSDKSTISWACGAATECSYGFTAGDLGHISAPMTVTASTQVGVVLRQGANFEFATVPEHMLALLLLAPFLPEALKKLRRQGKGGLHGTRN